MVDECRPGDGAGHPLHLGGGRDLIVGAADDQRRDAMAASSAGPVGAIAQRLDPGDKAGRARLGARAQEADQRGGRPGESSRARLPSR